MASSQTDRKIMATLGVRYGMSDLRGREESRSTIVRAAEVLVWSVVVEVDCGRSA